MKWLKYAYRKGISSGCEINFGLDVACGREGPFLSLKQDLIFSLLPVVKFSVSLTEELC